MVRIDYSTGIPLANYKLFEPLKIDDQLTLKNRVVMGPLTRARSDKDHVPNALNQEYYEQRAGAGLIISEATAICDQGFGWHGAPALYNDVHCSGWKPVIERVHQQGGAIFMQMWHMGRQAHSSFNSKGEIVSASGLRFEHGHDKHTRNVHGEPTPYETPRALDTHEIADIVETYRRSAQLAKEAGFDGVEIHSANGYLIDEFLQSCTNQRTDKYGGSFENRSRFLLEVIDALKTVYPASRIACRLSPNGSYGGMGSSDNYEMFTYLMRRLRGQDLAYVAILDGFGFGYHDSGRLVTAFDAKEAFRGRVLACNSYTRDTAEGALRTGSADMVAFGRWWISNPDLVDRFRHDWPLNADADRSVYWDATKKATGYTDFPRHSDVVSK
ncbi:TPA: hypothetical protein N0F65_012853 [Lagenidium giganteum]|uniref:NADH:flavin oxidoreductase/NADH oxidase N-terminal domain-containing protein n=1 Tax=Lagenidium giganteum TaxID=4803 RepID=A0AAV2YLS3_9STRA|nr:TPA: hypothetical protein N0F65_012853 [Lagenidium giganteum]